MLCDFFGEGLQYQENLLAKYYVKHGHAVSVVTSLIESVFEYANDTYRRPSGGPRESCVNGIRIRRLPYRTDFLKRVRTFAPLDDYLESEAPDLIYVHDIMLNLPDAVRYVRRHPNAKLILDYHADYSNSGRNWASLRVLHGIIRKRALDRARPHLAGLFPITPPSARFLHEVYRVPYEEMELLPLGTDLDLCREVELSDARTRLRAQHGVGEDGFVIITGGKLAPRKRTEMLIEAFHNLGDANVWLVVVGAAEGDAKYDDLLRRTARGSPRVIFTGWLDTRSVCDYFAMADVAVFPGSQSILWQQAIGMGKPLVIAEPMARSGGDQDVSYLNRCGNILVSEDPDTRVEWLAKTISRLMHDRDLCSRMSMGARSVASEMLDWNVTIAKTLQCCRTP